MLDIKQNMGGKRMLLRKKMYGLLSVPLVAALLLTGCSSKGTDVSAKKNVAFELDVNNFNSSTHHYAYNVYEPWAELVEEKTDGRVKVNLYHGGALGKSTSVFQDVRGGLYDVGLIVPNYFYDTGFFPYTIGNLPFAIEGPEEAAVVLNEFGEKYANKDLTDIIVLPATSTDGYDLFTTKPVRTADDLKKLKMRINGKSEIAFVESLGGVPVSLATEDTYEGLQKSTINTIFYTPIGGNDLKFFEPAPYITKLGASVTPVIPIMNKDFYEDLPDDLKKIFDDELNPKLTELFTESYKKELEASYVELENAVDGRGEIITLSDDEMANFKVLGEDAWKVWIEDANKKGYQGEEMADDFFNMLKEAGYSIPY